MAGGLGPAYGQTDVMHDRSYLIRQLASGRRADREQARVALDDLNQQEALQQRNIALQQREQALFQRQVNQEANQRRIMAHQNAMEMDKQLKMDRDTEIDEQGHGLLLSMMKLDAAKRRGEIDKTQYDQGILDAATQFPMGLRHPEAKKHLEFVTHEADRQNEFLARRKVIDDAKTAARLTGPPPEKIVQRYARVQGDIKSHTDASGLEEATNIANKLANRPYSKAADLHGAQREAQLLEQSYPQLTGQIQQTQSVATPTVTPTPSPTPAPQQPADEFAFLGLPNAQPSTTPVSTPSPSPSLEATATPAGTPPTIEDLFPAP